MRGSAKSSKNISLLVKMIFRFHNEVKSGTLFSFDSGPLQVSGAC